MVVTDIEANGKDLQGAVVSAEISGTKWALGPKPTRRRWPKCRGGLGVGAGVQAVEYKRAGLSYSLRIQGLRNQVMPLKIIQESLSHPM